MEVFIAFRGGKQLPGIQYPFDAKSDYNVMQCNWVECVYLQKF